MDVTTIVLLVSLVITLSLAGYGYYLKQQQPKEGEVQAQFIVAGGCLTVATLTIISLLVTIICGLVKIWYYLHQIHGH